MISELKVKARIGQMIDTGFQTVKNYVLKSDNRAAGELEGARPASNWINRTLPFSLDHQYSFKIIFTESMQLHAVHTLSKRISKQRSDLPASRLFALDHEAAV